VRHPVDYHAAGTADTFPAVVVEGDRLFAFRDELFVDHVEHFEERHVLAHIVRCVVFEATFVGRAFLAPDLEEEFEAHL